MRVPENQIVRFGVAWQWSSSRRRDIFEELYAWPELRAEGGDTKASHEHLIQVFLLDAVVLAFAGNAQTNQVAINRQTLLRVAHHNGGVINAEKGVCAWALPFRS